MANTTRGSTTRSPIDDEIVDLTGEIPSSDSPIEDIPRTTMTDAPVSSALDFDEKGATPFVSSSTEEPMSSKLSELMTRRPWLAVGILAGAGFLARRLLGGSRHETEFESGTLIELPPGSRLRAAMVEQGR